MSSESITAREREALHLLARERLRNALLAAISHDLRTPLAALVGMAESLTLADGSPERRYGELARGIREIAARVNSQVNNLLDMTRLQCGQVDLGCQWLPLEEAIGGALHAMESVLDARRVRTTLPLGLPLLYVSPVLFDRVLCNLLENAAKYSPASSPIEISAEAAADQVRIFVDDRGPGLTQHREEVIFRMFERDCKERATPGLGLGLAICRAIVEAHGGTITGESRPGGGARFAITLPLGEPPGLGMVEDDDRAAAQS
jgi:two-component system, OmpR family, sensor histidine kinase KdpD